MTSWAKIYNPFSAKQYFFVETNDITQSTAKLIDNKNEIIHFKRTEAIDFEQIILKSSYDKSVSDFDFDHLVSKAIHEIKNNINITKLVVARQNVFQHIFPMQHLSICYQSLLKNYNSYFVFCIYIDEELWIGASPELVGVISDGVFDTISLAGTVAKDQSFDKKEKEEQDIVSQYIHSILLQYGGNTMVQDQEEILFGTIKHLRNKFSIPLKLDLFDELVLDIHPSPALVGHPKIDSIEFLNENEPFDRKLYTSMMICHVEHEVAFAFALIRCAKLSANQIVYYAGTGITADSKPTMEVEESNNKMDTIKKMIEPYL